NDPCSLAHLLGAPSGRWSTTAASRPASELGTSCRDCRAHANENRPFDSDLPLTPRDIEAGVPKRRKNCQFLDSATGPGASALRSEEHTSELQSRVDLVCRLLLEKKKKCK